MVTGFIYNIRRPESMNILYSTDSEFAEEKSKSGFIVTARRYKTVGN